MREFPLEIDLKKGLRPYPKTPRNSGYLVEALGVKVTDVGLEPFDPIPVPFDYNDIHFLQSSWPFPQLVRGKEKTFLLMSNAVFMVNELDWSIFQLETLYDPKQILVSATTRSVKPGNQWQLIDFWDTWALHNGVSTVFHPGIYKYFSPTVQETFVTDDVRVQAGVDFKGRSWMGGFDPDYFYSPAWITFLEGLKTKGTKFPNTITGLDTNFVMTSSIGGGDMFQIFYATDWAEKSFEAGGTEIYGSSKDFYYEFFHEKLRENTAYVAPMPWQGKVRKMMVLGQSVIVYGDGGVTALTPTGQYVAQANYDDLKNGIHGVAVGGNQNEHLMIDQEGVMWYLEPNKRPQELGYKEWIYPMIGNDIVISHTPMRGGEFYICDGTKAYVLTKKGLTEHKQQITSIIHSQGSARCMYTYPEAINSTMRVVSDTLDFGERGNKTVNWVDLTTDLSDQVFYDDTTEIQVGFDYRYRNNQTFSRSPLKLANYNGQVSNTITAPDLRLVLQSNEFRNAVIKNATVRYQVPDRRFVRGKING